MEANVTNCSFLEHSTTWRQPVMWSLGSLIVFANLVLLTALLTLGRPLLRQRQNIFILSLALGDTCVGLVTPYNAYRNHEKILS